MPLFADLAEEAGRGGGGNRKSKRGAEKSSATPVEPAPVSADVAALGRTLPAGVHLGTSSWSFPGWRGLVYAGEYSPQDLARRGLTAYAKHPLLRTVGIDRSFYAPLTRETLAGYRAQVEEAGATGFRFLMKAFEGVTRPEPLADVRAKLDAREEQVARGVGGAGAPAARNPYFLDAAYAAEQIVAPAVEGLGATLGPIVFQFSRMRLGELGGAAGFITRLGAFLSALPRGPLYAVEVRNAELVTERRGADLARALAEAGCVPCLAGHPLMPPVAAQARALGRPRGEAWPAVVARWMLHATQTYEGARARYMPFDRLVDEDPGTRGTLAALAARAAATARPVWITANNKAEGSAPGTCEALARAIVERALARGG